MTTRKPTSKPAAEHTSAAEATATDEQRILAAKFDLGPEVDREAGEPLPWGYGECVIRALSVDPGQLLLYWEVTDEGIDAARRRLPASEAERAELCLRIYDTTGRIFDGTNAHSFLDVPIGRRERQWFLELGKPGSEQCAEVGLRAPGGAFARIARSLEVAQPRREPWPVTTESWMTVRPGADGRLEIERLSTADVLAPVAGRPAALTPEEIDAARIAALEAQPPGGGTAAEASHPGSSEQSQPRSEAPWRGSGQA